MMLFLVPTSLAYMCYDENDMFLQEYGSKHDYLNDMGSQGWVVDDN